MRNQLGVIAASAICICGQADATVIYTEDANGLTPGDNTLQDSGTDWGAPASDYGVVGATSAFTTNSFELTAPDANFNFANWNDGNTYPVLTVSLDLVDLGTSTSSDASVRLAMRRGTGSAFYDVTAAATPDNTIVHYDIIINAGASAVDYEAGGTSIAANTLEVWSDGTMVASATANGSGNSIGFGLWNRRPDNAFLMDNIEIRDTAFAVPEPSITLLGGLGILGLIRRRRH